PISSSAPHGDGHQSLPIGFVVCASACRTPPTVSLAIIPAAMPATRPPVTKSRRETPSSVDVVLGVSSATVCWHCSLCWGTKYCLSHPDCIRHPPSIKAFLSLRGPPISPPFPSPTASEP